MAMSKLHIVRNIMGNSGASRITKPNPPYRRQIQYTKQIQIQGTKYDLHLVENRKQSQLYLVGSTLEEINAKFQIKW